METLQEIIGLKDQLAQPSTAEILELSPAARIAGNMERYHTSPWEMIRDQIIYTFDEVDMLHPVKAFPNNPWLEHVTETWLQVKLLALFKSRRMMITWLMVFLHTWLCMFRENAAIFFVSSKEEKSDELVKRAKFILDYMPDDMILKPTYKYTYCHLTFPKLGSRIQGVPEGADQLRQYGATAILDDEIAFWDRPRETFMASKPTIDGGGRVTCVSSPMEGFFKDLCFDLIR